MLSILILVLAGASQICEAVVNGHTADRGEFPYAVALFRDGHFFCTGSIICEKKILTAGHCAKKDGVVREPGVYHGIIGTNNKAHKEIKIEFEKVQPHPDFQRHPILNDLAIFTTKEPITFTENIRPLCLAKKETEIDAYDSGTAMGWGVVYKRGPDEDHPDASHHLSTPDHLQYVEQSVLTYEECKRVAERDYHTPKNMTKTIICTKADETHVREATCKGDSGGPLVHRRNKGENENVDVNSHVKDIQIGITSAGSHVCGHWPTDSTRVSAYADFIQEQADGCNLCFL